MKPLVNKKYLLEKFPGKGGWTFARIPDIIPGSDTPFGWVRVKGSIDDAEISKYHLMPMGNGHLFLPVKAGIRKQIGKQAGDTVHVILYADHDTLQIPPELQECLDDEPAAAAFFKTLTDSQKKYYCDWIFSAKHETTKIKRLGIAIDRLLKQQKFHDIG